MHKKFTRNSSTLKLPPKGSNLERSRFKASLYLKQRFKFELSILITSATGIRFQSQPHFKPEVTTMIVCRTVAE